MKNMSQSGQDAIHAVLTERRCCFINREHNTRPSKVCGLERAIFSYNLAIKNTSQGGCKLVVHHERCGRGYVAPAASPTNVLQIIHMLCDILREFSFWRHCTSVVQDMRKILSTRASGSAEHLQTYSR